MNLFETKAKRMHSWTVAVEDPTRKFEKLVPLCEARINDYSAVRPTREGEAFTRSRLVSQPPAIACTT